jgi:hypothetical protein
MTMPKTLTTPSASFELDLYQDWSDALVARLVTAGFTVPPTLNSRECALAYFNVLYRAIPVRPRRFQYPAGFQCPAVHFNGLQLLETASQAGDNLMPWQSKTVVNAGFIDELYFDWGIQHFHLGEHADHNDPRFVARSAQVLLGIVHDDDVYCIDVREHGPKRPMLWVERDLLEIVERSWPDLIRPWLTTGRNLFPPYDEEEYNRLRRAGIFQMVELRNGNIYAPPGGGMTTGKVGLNVLRLHDYHARNLGVLYQRIGEQRERIEADLRNAGARGSTFGLCLRDAPDAWELVEPQSQHIVVLEDIPGINLS